MERENLLPTGVEVLRLQLRRVCLCSGRDGRTWGRRVLASFSGGTGTLDRTQSGVCGLSEVVCEGRHRERLMSSEREEAKGAKRRSVDDDDSVCFVFSGPLVCLSMLQMQLSAT